MSEQTGQEAVMRYLKQVCFAVAILLVLYGIVQLLNFFSDLANTYVSYYLWIFFQIIAAILIIFIGFKVYSFAKTVKAVNLIYLWTEARPQFLVLLLGCLALLPMVFHPLPASSFIYPQPLRPYFIHHPISFQYRLNYKWDFQEGGSIQMITIHNYRSRPYQIIIDIIEVDKGWIIVPYGIDGSNAICEALGPATVSVDLGLIANNDYILKIIMSNAIDVFVIRKTGNKFWVEEVRVIKGNVVQKSEFEKRLDGFRVEFIGFPNIDDETKTIVLENIQGIGGEIVDTKSYYEGWTVDWYFYYNGEHSDLRQIIREIATGHPNYMIGIYSNAGWYSLTWVPDSYQ